MHGSCDAGGTLAGNKEVRDSGGKGVRKERKEGGRNRRMLVGSSLGVLLAGLKLLISNMLLFPMMCHKTS